MNSVPQSPLLSIAIMTHNEIEDLKKLFAVLEPWLSSSIELVVVDDFSDEKTSVFLSSFMRDKNGRLEKRALQNHFAKQRNFLKSFCRGRFILILDPDEMPPEGFLAHLSKITEMMDSQDLDLCLLPRANHLLDEDGAVIETNEGFPDYQERFLRNRPQIFWINRVHERLIGYRRKYIFPADAAYAIRHVKKRRKLETASSYYDRIQNRAFDKYRKIILKKLGLIRKESVALPPPY